MGKQNLYAHILRPRDRTAIRAEINHTLNVAQWEPEEAACRCADMIILHQNCMARDVRQAIKIVDKTAKEFLIETGARIDRVPGYKIRLRWKYERLALPELRYRGDNRKAIEALYKAATVAERKSAEDLLRKHAELGADVCLFGLHGIDNNRKPIFSERTDEKGLVREVAGMVLGSFNFPKDNAEALRWAETYGTRDLDTRKLLAKFLTESNIKEKLRWYYERAGDFVIAAASFGTDCIRQKIK